MVTLKKAIIGIYSVIYGIIQIASFRHIEPESLAECERVSRTSVAKRH